MAEKFKILSTGGDGKGLNIFKSTAYKEHEVKPIAQAFWNIRWGVGIWLAAALAFALSFIFEHIWRYGWIPATGHWTWLYIKQMFATGGLSVVAEIPTWIIRSVARADMACIVPLIPIIAYFFMADSTLTKEFNPHGKDKFDEKSSRKANEADIKKMGKYDNPEGLFKGFMMVLGYFKHKGKTVPLMMDETLSALLLAPPGTGKTEGIVLPTIYECTETSMIINDPKPELDYKSSGYRAAHVGPVFIMNWAGQDDPENGIYYPSWNPLSPEHVPFEQEKRDLYIDTICNVLVPDNPSSSADPHWQISGRAALSGVIQYIVSKVERARADDYFYSRLHSGTFDSEDATVLMGYYMSMHDDPNAYAAASLLQRGELTLMNYVHIGTWEHIPPDWVGHEASLSLILDWLNASQLAVAEELEERRRQGDQMVMMADPMKDLLDNAVAEARQYAYAHRAVLELTQLANTPDRERGSIISTFMAGIGIFRNAAVRNRTSHSDFHFEDLRGMIDPSDGKMKPVTVYLSINMVDAQALNPITGIFIELMSNYLLANVPGQVNNGKKLGPYPVLFLMDEMPKMQKLQAIIQGPDLGRGQKISYLIVGQDIHQIEEKYGKDAASTIISTTAAKIVFRQNDPETAKNFSEMMGKKITKKIEKTKDDKGNEKEKEVEDKNEMLYSPMDIMSLKQDKEIIIYQGWYHRPIEAELKLALFDPRLASFRSMGRASPLPEFLIPAHHAAMGYTGNPRVYNPLTKELKEIIVEKK